MCSLLLSESLQKSSSLDQNDELRFLTASFSLKLNDVPIHIPESCIKSYEEGMNFFTSGHSKNSKVIDGGVILQNRSKFDDYMLRLLKEFVYLNCKDIILDAIEFSLESSSVLTRHNKSKEESFSKDLSNPESTKCLQWIRSGSCPSLSGAMSANERSCPFLNSKSSPYIDGKLQFNKLCDSPTDIDGEIEQVNSNSFPAYQKGLSTNRRLSFLSPSKETVGIRSKAPNTIKNKSSAILENSPPTVKPSTCPHRHVQGARNSTRKTVVRSTSDSSGSKRTTACTLMSNSVQKRLDVLKHVAEVQRQYLEAKGPKVVYGALLQGVLDLLNCEFGFIGEVKFENDDPSTMYLHSHATTTNSWNPNTLKYFANYASGLKFYRFDTLFGEVITKKAPVLSNNPRTDPRRGHRGCPAGHPPLINFLGVPFFRKNGDVMGMIAIANKTDGFNELDIGFLEPFTATAANLVQAYMQIEANENLIDTLEIRVMKRTQELQAANEHLASANERVMQASAAQLKHFACMSHEIRTPLNCIIGLSSLLLENSISTPYRNTVLARSSQQLINLGSDESHKLSPAQLEAMQMIVASGDLLLTVVNDVLDYSKLENGDVEIEVQKSSLQDTLNGIVHSIEMKGASKNIKIRTLYDSIVPEYVTTDSRRLQQILYNLLGNALKFSPTNTHIDLTVQLVYKNDSIDIERKKVEMKSSHSITTATVPVMSTFHHQPQNPSTNAITSLLPRENNGCYHSVSTSCPTDDSLLPTRNIAQGCGRVVDNILIHNCSEPLKRVESLDNLKEARQLVKSVQHGEGTAHTSFALAKARLRNRNTLTLTPKSDYDIVTTETNLGNIVTTSLSKSELSCIVKATHDADDTSFSMTCKGMRSLFCDESNSCIHRTINSSELPSFKVPIDQQQGDTFESKHLLPSCHKNTIGNENLCQPQSITVSKSSNANLVMVNDGQFVSPTLQNVTLRVQVRDYGIGIAEEDFGRIFEPFSQATAETERVFGGTGLGLAITSRLVQALGGSVSVASEVGKYSEFTIDLPFLDSPYNLQSTSETLSNHTHLFVIHNDSHETQKYITRVLKQANLKDAATLLPKFDDFESFIIKKKKGKEGKSSIESYPLMNKKFFICLIHEDQFNQDQFIHLQHEISPSRMILFTMGPQYRVSDGKGHFRSLHHVLPSVFLETLANALNAELSNNNKTKNQPNGKEKVQESLSVRDYLLYQQLRILIAEDNKINQKVLCRILVRMGITNIDIVDNGFEAVQYEKKKQYDLIFMDLQMPIMDGVEAAKTIHQSRILTNGEMINTISHPIPSIIFVTAHAEASYQQECIAVGGAGFLSKPYSVHDIETLVHRMFVQQKQQN